MMFSDGSASTSERSKVRELMRKVGAPWDDADIDRRVGEFVDRAKLVGLEGVVEETCQLLENITEPTHRDVFLKCLKQVAEIDGNIDRSERIAWNRFKSAFESRRNLAESVASPLPRPSGSIPHTSSSNETNRPISRSVAAVLTRITSANLNYVRWFAVGIAWLAGIAVIVVLLKGDPTYLVEETKDRFGIARTGNFRPIPFSSRFFVSTILAVNLIVAGIRAVSDAVEDLWLPTVIGFALFVLDVIVCACKGLMFPQFLTIHWCSLLLTGLVYSEAICEFNDERVPLWIIWGGFLLGLAARVAWSVSFHEG